MRTFHTATLLPADRRFEQDMPRNSSTSLKLQAESGNRKRTDSLSTGIAEVELYNPKPLTRRCCWAFLIISCYGALHSPCVVVVAQEDASFFEILFGPRPVPQLESQVIDITRAENFAAAFPKKKGFPEILKVVIYQLLQHPDVLDPEFDSAEKLSEAIITPNAYILHNDVSAVLTSWAPYSEFIVYDLSDTPLTSNEALLVAMAWRVATKNHRDDSYQTLFEELLTGSEKKTVIEILRSVETAFYRQAAYEYFLPLRVIPRNTNSTIANGEIIGMAFSLFPEGRTKNVLKREITSGFSKANALRCGPLAVKLGASIPSVTLIRDQQKAPLQAFQNSTNRHGQMDRCVSLSAETKRVESFCFDPDPGLAISQVYEWRLSGDHPTVAQAKYDFLRFLVCTETTQRCLATWFSDLTSGARKLLLHGVTRLTVSKGTFMPDQWFALDFSESSQSVSGSGDRGQPITATVLGCVFAVFSYLLGARDNMRHPHNHYEAQSIFGGSRFDIENLHNEFSTTNSTSWAVEDIVHRDGSKELVDKILDPKIKAIKSVSDFLNLLSWYTTRQYVKGYHQNAKRILRHVFRIMGFKTGPTSLKPAQLWW